ncbi:hypothetical protein MNBD_GAMMA08-2579 [hydrothermal vent metagenome]|uniref:Uncharacterized protein n=1 Tax=hydrothermal vent metagenome TaxID=652676 RepID=A0A3B0Y7D1_9ZZZZ
MSIDIAGEIVGLKRIFDWQIKSFDKAARQIKQGLLFILLISL